MLVPVSSGCFAAARDGVRCAAQLCPVSDMTQDMRQE